MRLLCRLLPAGRGLVLLGLLLSSCLSEPSSITTSTRSFAATASLALPDDPAAVGEILGPNLALPGRDTPWGGYLVVDPQSGVVVGTCAFKGPPRDGAVEIAYFTFPAFERQRYGGAMARQLIAIADAAPEVGLIVAHTLPEPSASTRILAAAGLDLIGEVDDPEDGRVWRWQRQARHSA